MWDQGRRLRSRGWQDFSFPVAPFSGKESEREKTLQHMYSKHFIKQITHPSQSQKVYSPAPDKYTEPWLSRYSELEIWGIPFCGTKLSPVERDKKWHFKGEHFCLDAGGSPCCCWQTKHGTSAALQCKAQPELLNQLCSRVTAIKPWSLHCVSPSGLNTHHQDLTIAQSYHSMAIYLVD